MRYRSAFLLPLVVVAGSAIATPAIALETSRDVETDHFDGADDGGPRSWAFALRPLDLDVGLVGVELGASLGERVVLSFETAWWAADPARAYGVVAGLAVFPARFAFHGFYVHPRLEAWRAPASGNAFGLGTLVGYEWTAPVGATARLGGGLAYVTWTGPPAIEPPVAIAGMLPELDAAVGWVF
ncbi:MAG: hypothetical protein ACRENE_06975 [Polyangiaceae bacterium]